MDVDMDMDMDMDKSAKEDGSGRTKRREGRL